MNNCPLFLKPRLRLFLSADIVGSTALKQTHGQQEDVKADRWFSAIQGFYIESNRSFLTSWQEITLAAGSDVDCGSPPEMWKTVGDEVLFIKELTSYRQLALTLTAWIKALQAMRDFVRGQDSRLDVKCTAWAAGFPIKNKEVVLRGISLKGDEVVDDYFLSSGRVLNCYYDNNRISSEISVDYIGPSIDTGFRLSTLSSSRKFVISVDVAYILALTMPFSGYPADTLRIFYGGPTHLKGVMGGVDYPQFWIDTGIGRLPSLEDNLSGARAGNRDHIAAYCEEFYEIYQQYLFKPFIYSDKEQQIVARPSWYDSKHALLVKNYRQSESEEQGGPGSEPTKIENTTTFTSTDWAKLVKTFARVVRDAAAVSAASSTNSQEEKASNHDDSPNDPPESGSERDIQEIQKLDTPVSKDLKRPRKRRIIVDGEEARILGEDSKSKPE